MVIHYLHTFHLITTRKKHHFYRGEESMEMFCVNLKAHVVEIINFEIKNAASDNERHTRNKNSVACAKKNEMICLIYLICLMRMKIIVGSGIIVIIQGNLWGCSKYL